MRIDGSLYPMHWPCGALELVLRQRVTKDLPEKLVASLSKWATPESLTLLRGTPINCLMVHWAAGVAEDAKQQQQLRPLLARAKALQLQVIGYVQPPADLKRAADCGRTAGLSGLAAPSLPETGLALPVIQRAEREKVNWTSPSASVVLTDSVWPGIRGLAAGSRRPAIAGPTGIPWLDSNAWLVQWARRRSEGKSQWLEYEPPQTGFAVDAECYLQALADAESAGARWIVSLDDAFRSSLDSLQTAALGNWRQITAAMAFFQSRSAWNQLSPHGALGIADGNGDVDAFIRGEILNLLGRRQVPFRILGMLPSKPEELQDLVAILCSETVVPNESQRAFLLEFVGRGGLLIAPNTWEKPGGMPRSHDLQDDYGMYPIGAGRLAVARKPWEDPYRVAEQVHLLMSRRNDLFRLANSETVGVHCTSSSDRKKTLIHLVNFDRSPRRKLQSLWVRQRFQTARLWKLGANEPMALTAKPGQGGQELELPPFAVYVAVELDS